MGSPPSLRRTPTAPAACYSGKAGYCRGGFRSGWGTASSVSAEGIDHQREHDDDKELHDDEPCVSEGDGGREPDHADYEHEADDPDLTLAIAHRAEHSLLGAAGRRALRVPS